MSSMDWSSADGPNATWLREVATRTPPTSGPARSTRTARYRTSPIGGPRSTVPDCLRTRSESSSSVSRSISAASSVRATSESARTWPRGVGDDQVVADGIEVGADPGIERGPGARGRHDAAEDVVRLAEPAVGEIGLQQEPLVQLPHARRPPLQVEKRAEGEHGHAQRDRVPEGEPPADGGHLTPLRRTPRPAPCAPASARGPSRPSCGDG